MAKSSGGGSGAGRSWGRVPSGAASVMTVAGGAAADDIDKAILAAFNKTGWWAGHDVKSGYYAARVDVGGQLVAVASFRDDSHDPGRYYIGHLGSVIGPGQGARALYEVIRHSARDGFGGQISLSSVTAPSTVAFYDKVGFDRKGLSGYRQLSSRAAQAFVNAYSVKAGLTSFKV